MAEDLVSTAKAARAIGVGVSTLQLWAAQGRVTPAWRTPGGQARWDVADLHRQLGKPWPREDQLVPDASNVPVRPPIVAVVATCELGVLITKRRDGVPPWGFLTGKIEQGESPADAAEREAKEEAGLHIRAGEPIAERIHPKTKTLTYYMEATPVHGTDVHVGDTDELEWVGWVPLAEAAERMAAFGGMYPPVYDYLAALLSA